MSLQCSLSFIKEHVEHTLNHVCRGTLMMSRKTRKRAEINYKNTVWVSEQHSLLMGVIVAHFVFTEIFSFQTAKLNQVSKWITGQTLTKSPLIQRAAAADLNISSLRVQCLYSSLLRTMFYFDEQNQQSKNKISPSHEALRQQSPIRICR